MPSRIFYICDSYESGYGHGLNNDGLDLSKTPHGDPECGEAYQIGYELGLEKYNLGQVFTFHEEQDRGELKPCPHCGSTDLSGPNFHEYLGDYITPHWIVECNICPCSMTVWARDKKRVLEAWNMRK